MTRIARILTCIPWINMFTFYKLKGKTPVAVDRCEWVPESVRVDFSRGEGWEISTVFWPVSLQIRSGRKIQLFETLVCVDDSSATYRWTTWDEAEAGHRSLVRQMRFVNEITYRLTFSGCIEREFLSLIKENFPTIEIGPGLYSVSVSRDFDPSFLLTIATTARMLGQENYSLEREELKR